MRPNMAISNFVSRCLNGEPPVVYGDGTQTRDFTYVDDVLGVNRTLLHSEAADGEAVNVGSTDTIEIRTLAAEIRDQLAPELDLEFADRYDADADHTHADTAKAARLLEYDPGHTIREGVAAFIEWYRANREWYEPLVLAS
jgi:UDP-glucose 4-epimerase